MNPTKYIVEVTVTKTFEVTVSDDNVNDWEDPEEAAEIIGQEAFSESGRSGEWSRLQSEETEVSAWPAPLAAAAE